MIPFSGRKDENGEWVYYCGSCGSEMDRTFVREYFFDKVVRLTCPKCKNGSHLTTEPFFDDESLEVADE